MARNHTNAQKAVRACTSHCAYCERKLYTTGKQHRTIDHFYPLQLGPELNKGWNKVVCCKRCNNIKRNLLPEQFIVWVSKAKVILDSEYESDIKDIIKNVKLLIAEKSPWFKMRDLL